MDNAADILTNCSTSNGILALALLIIGGVIFLWKQNKDNRNETKLEIKEVKEDIKVLSNKVSDINKRIYGVEQNFIQKNAVY